MSFSVPNLSYFIVVLSEHLLQCHASCWFTCPSASQILFFLCLFAVTQLASISGCFTWIQPLAKQKEIRTLHSNFCGGCLFFSTVKPCAFHPFILAHTFDVVPLISGSQVHSPLISCPVFSKTPSLALLCHLQSSRRGLRLPSTFALCKLFLPPLLVFCSLLLLHPLL